MSEGYPVACVVFVRRDNLSDSPEFASTVGFAVLFAATDGNSLVMGTAVDLMTGQMCAVAEEPVVATVVTDPYEAETVSPEALAVVAVVSSAVASNSFDSLLKSL